MLALWRQGRLAGNLADLLTQHKQTADHSGAITPTATTTNSVGSTLAKTELSPNNNNGVINNNNVVSTANHQNNAAVVNGGASIATAVKPTHNLTSIPAAPTANSNGKPAAWKSGPGSGGMYSADTAVGGKIHHATTSSKLADSDKCKKKTVECCSVM